MITICSKADEPGCLSTCIHRKLHRSLIDSCFRPCNSGIFDAGCYGVILDDVEESRLKTRLPMYLKILEALEERSTCRPDRPNGALLIGLESMRVKAMGYSGSPAGVGHCKDDGCLKHNGHCINTLHAEVNCLANWEGQKNERLLMLSTRKPCLNCYKVMMAFKVDVSVYVFDYDGEDGFDLFYDTHKCVRILPTFSISLLS